MNLIAIVGILFIVGAAGAFVVFRIVMGAKEKKADQMLTDGDVQSATALFGEIATSHTKRLRAMLEDFAAGRSKSAGNAVRVHVKPLNRLAGKLQKAGSLSVDQHSNVVKFLAEIDNTGKQYSVGNMKKEEADRCLTLLTQCESFLGLA